MILKRLTIVFGFLLACLLFSSRCFAEKITLTTYYPAPFGAYDRVRFVPRDPAGITCSDENEGIAFYDSVAHQLQICQYNTTGNSYNFESTGGVWTQEGNFLYPNDVANPNLRIGIGTATPYATLDIDDSTNPGNPALIIRKSSTGPSANIGILSAAGGESATAIWANAAAEANGQAIAILGTASLFGGWTTPQPGTTHIGVYGSASGGATNWAGYFDGNTVVSGKRLIVGATDQVGSYGANDTALEINGKPGSDSTGLYINGPDNAAAVGMSSSKVGSTPVNRLSFNGADLGFYDPGIGDVMTIEFGTGRVGIGTVPTGTAKLEVADFLDKADVEVLRLENSGLPPNGSAITFSGGAAGGKIVGGYPSSGGLLDFYTGNVRRMRINGPGYVGIGTTNPEGFQVSVGVLGQPSSIGESGVRLGLYDAKPSIVFENTPSVWDITGGSGLVFRHNGLTRAVFTDTGNVGIGTVAPGTKLAVAGLTGNATHPYLRYDTATGNIYYDSSSRRYKDDIKPLKDDFYKILAVAPKAFVQKGTNEKDIGFIAEEFDAAGLKNLVYYRDGQPDGIKYEKVSLYLLEVIKELHKRIEVLEKEIDALK